MLEALALALADPLLRKELESLEAQRSGTQLDTRAGVSRPRRASARKSALRQTARLCKNNRGGEWRCRRTAATPRVMGWRAGGRVRGLAYVIVGNAVGKSN